MRVELRRRSLAFLFSTLNYVRKCCKYVDRNETEENTIDPAIFLEENAAARRSRSRSPSATPPPVKRALSSESDRQTSASLAETFIRHNRKHLESYRSSPVSRKQAGSRTSTLTVRIVRSLARASSLLARLSSRPRPFPVKLPLSMTKLRSVTFNFESTRRTANHSLVKPGNRRHSILSRRWESVPLALLRTRAPRIRPRWFARSPLRCNRHTTR